MSSISKSNESLSSVESIDEREGLVEEWEITESEITPYQDTPMVPMAFFFFGGGGGRGL